MAVLHLAGAPYRLVHVSGIRVPYCSVVCERSGHAADPLLVGLARTERDACSVALLVASEQQQIGKAES